VTAAYQRLRVEQGGPGSPAIGTFLLRQRPGAFEAVVVAPEGDGPAEAGVIFLHGFMGNVALQCWLVAEPARALGMVTVCPSTGPVGAWWTPAGEATVQATLRFLRGRGVQRIYLGGFSNGGLGLSRLAAGVSGEAEVSGLFFIAGVSEGAALRATGLPVLIVQGAHDERLGVGAAQRAAAEIGAAATYAELEADHFLIVKAPGEVQAALGDWLARQEARPIN
jgi:pimeloyl-ACP methyl ester carboxylesterase